MKTSSNNNNIESKNNQVFNSCKEQYEAIKYGRPWYLLLFYWGAHYAAYNKDAETVAEVLDGMDGVTTYEECGMKCTVFPVDALAEALPKLRARNEYISICDNLSHNGLYSRRTLADILNRNKTGRYYGECTDVFTSSDDREQADVKAEGCEVVRHIYYRIDCPDYEAGHDIDAFYSEVVKLLEAEGWHVEGDWQGAHCPTMRKGAQSLYCHPQSLSGEVSPVECDRIGQVLMTGETFRLRGIDDYGRIFLTASEEQERDLYRQNYQDGLADVLREVLTTKRSNLYRDKGDALGNAYRRTAIENIRTDMEDKGSNYYYWRKAVTEFVDSEYDRLLQAGYIKETEGQNGRTLCRWINKKEEKERAKAIREAEKAEKEREKATLEPVSEITEFFTKGKKYRCIKSVIGNKSGREMFTKGQVYEQYTEPSVFYGWLRNNQGERHAWPQIDEMADYLETWSEAKPEDIDPRLYFEPVEEITEAEGIKVGDKVRHNKHEEVATVTAIREAFVNGCDGYRYLYTLDFGQSVKGPFDVELNGGEFLREAFTLQEALEIKPKATDSELESLTAKYAKQIEESALLGCGCMVGDGDETRKDSKCVKVRTAYKNDSHDPKDWTYCVSWYETTPIKGDADGQHQILRECENGILLEQAAKHMAYFEQMTRKGWTLDEILYGKAA